jgi:Spy/CpxP family protein refolding chaperone
MIERVGAEIGISAAVREKIKETAYAAEKEQIQIRAKLDTARLDLRRAMDATEPDVKKVIRQVEAVGALETEMKKARVRLMLTVRSMLTAEQRAKLQQIIRDRWAERRGRRDAPSRPRGPGRRGGPDRDL